jgi:hypothetical protein
MKLYELIRKLAPGDLTIVEILSQQDMLEQLETYDKLMFELADALEYEEHLQELRD